ncbi:hypothetical protein [Buchnera aphidicola]|uniref:hypothetical protein n=1 Tax=Buchnera aphidicola TaxID=9 RepID=UPI0002F14BDD|nr:hypothetical protein [Buchnera aphidicola]
MSITYNFSFSKISKVVPVTGCGKRMLLNFLKPYIEINNYTILKQIVLSFY